MTVSWRGNALVRNGSYFSTTERGLLASSSERFVRHKRTEPGAPFTEVFAVQEVAYALSPEEERQQICADSRKIEGLEEGHG